MKRPFTQDELQELSNRGYDVSEYKGELADFPDPPPTSPVAAGARAAGASALPTLAGGAGFGLTMLALAPETLGASLLAIPAAAAVGYAGSKLASKGQEAVMPESWKEKLAADVAEHPVATTLGGIATMPLAGMSPSVANLGKAAGAVTRLAGRLPTTLAEQQALLNVGAGAALGGVQEAATAKLEGRDITPGSVALGAALGAGFSSPNAIGRRLYGFHPTPEQVVTNPRLLAKTLEVAKEQQTPRQPIFKWEAPDIFSPEEQIRRSVGIRDKLTKSAETSAKAIFEAEKAGQPITPRDDPSINKTIDEITAKIKASDKKKSIIPPAKTEVDVTAPSAEAPKGPEVPRTELFNEVSGKLDVPTAVTPEYVDTLTREVMAKHKIKVTPDGNLTNEKGEPINGKALLPNAVREILFNPKTATIDTIPHEGLHYLRTEMEMAAHNGDKAAQTLLQQWDALNKPEFDTINALRKERGLPEQDPHEFAVSQQGYEFVKQQFGLNKEGPVKRWWNDTKALFNAKYRTKSATLGDLRRAINFRFVHEGTIKPQVGFGHRKQPKDEGLIPKGYRQVNLVKPDGTREPVYFNDKYYEGFGEPKPASIARMVDGALSHGATRKGERIEEIGSRNQPEGEGIISEEPRSDLYDAYIKKGSPIADATEASLKAQKELLSILDKKHPQHVLDYYDPRLISMLENAVRSEDGFKELAAIVESDLDASKLTEMFRKTVEHGDIVNKISKVDFMTRHPGVRNQDQNEGLPLNPEWRQDQQEELDALYRPQEKTPEQQKFEEMHRVVDRAQPEDEGLPKPSKEELEYSWDAWEARARILGEAVLKVYPNAGDKYKAVRVDPIEGVGKTMIEALANNNPTAKKLVDVLIQKGVIKAAGSNDWIRETIAHMNNVRENNGFPRLEYRPQGEDEGLTRRKEQMRINAAAQRERNRQAAEELRAGKPARERGPLEGQPQGGRPLHTPLDQRKNVRDILNLESREGLADFNEYVRRAVYTAANHIRAEGHDLPPSYSKVTERGMNHDDYKAIMDAVKEDVLAHGVDSDTNQGAGAMILRRTLYRRARDAWKKAIMEKSAEKGTVPISAKAGEGETILDTIAAPKQEIQRQTVAPKVAEGMSKQEAAKAKIAALEEERKLAIEEYGSEDAEAVQDIDAELDIWKQRAGSREQPANEGLFTTKATKLLRTKEIKPSNEDTYQGDQLLGALRNRLSPVEYEALKVAGLEDYVKGRYVKRDDVQKWIAENGPRVEVKKFGEAAVTPETREIAQLRHKFDTLGKDPHDSTLEWTPEQQADRKRLQQLEKLMVEEPRRFALQRNTSHWSSVAPKSERDMPGYVEIAVVKPGKSSKYKDWEQMTSEEKKAIDLTPQFPSSHNFPPNTLGFVRGYMEGDTFHIIEVQSDWAQSMRNRKARLDAPLPEQDREIYQYQRENERKGYEAASEPMLQHYERLALKAAIEHAREAGAKRIAISDAETAMMTEGHDRMPIVNRGKYEVPELKGKTFSTTDHQYGYTTTKVELTGKVDVPARGLEREEPLVETTDGKWVELPDKLQETFYNAAPKSINQEPGMRLHYDKSLQKIAEELTGAKGEKVSFGEHKMALTDTSRGYQASNPDEGVKPNYRKDLIFKNPDGTPKTDVSALSYPLDKVSAKLESGDNFTLFNKHQGADEGLTSRVKSAITDKEGFLSAMAPTFDKVKPLSPALAQAGHNWEARRDQYLGMRNEVIDKLQRFDPEDVNAVSDLHRTAWRNDEELPALTGDKKEISNLLTQYYHDYIGKARRDMGLRIGSREAGLNKYYVPDQLNEDTIALFTKNPNSVEANAAKRDWANHVANESEGKITFDEALENITNYVEALGGGKNNYLSVNFGAIRKASGYGLPDSMRETDALKSMYRYGRRAAADLAMFQELESRPEIASLLKIPNPNTGKIPDHPQGLPALNAEQRVKDMMKWVTQNFGNTMSQDQPRVNALVRTVNNALLGPATGLRDTATVPLNAIPYITSFRDLGAFFKGLTTFREHADAALRTGARQPNIDLTQFNAILDAPDRATAILHKAGTILRKYQGREAIENLNRDIVFSVGKELANSWIIGAKNGDTRAANMLKKFSTLVPEDVTTLTGAELEAATDQIAKNFTDRNQGTYGGRGLPVGVVESQFAPFLSLQKWSIEKSNVIWQDVVKPFLTGENRMPLLTYTLGALMTGAGIQELNKLLTGRKAQDPTLKEAMEKGDTAAYVTQLATLMQLASYAGIVGDITKAASDVLIRGKQPRNVVSFPTATATLDTTEKLTDALEAFRQGEDPFEVVKKLTIDLATHNVQAVRMLANRTVKKEELERSDKFRDRRVFNELEGKPASDIPKSNQYLGLDTRAFKRADTASEVQQLAPVVIRKAIEKSKGNPEQLRIALRNLKANSYQTVPSPTENPFEFAAYYKFLVNTQGKEAADSRVRDYLTQTMLNKAKSRLVP